MSGVQRTQIDSIYKASFEGMGVELEEQESVLDKNVTFLSTNPSWFAKVCNRIFRKQDSLAPSPEPLLNSARKFHQIKNKLSRTPIDSRISAKDLRQVEEVSQLATIVLTRALSSEAYYEAQKKLALNKKPSGEEKVVQSQVLAAQALLYLSSQLRNRLQKISHEELPPTAEGLTPIQYKLYQEASSFSQAALISPEDPSGAPLTEEQRIRLEQVRLAEISPQQLIDTGKAHIQLLRDVDFPTRPIEEQLKLIRVSLAYFNASFDQICSMEEKSTEEKVAMIEGCREDYLLASRYMKDLLTKLKEQENLPSSMLSHLNNSYWVGFVDPQFVGSLSDVVENDSYRPSSNHLYERYAVESFSEEVAQEKKRLSQRRGELNIHRTLQAVRSASSSKQYIQDALEEILSPLLHERGLGLQVPLLIVKSASFQAASLPLSQAKRLLKELNLYRSAVGHIPASVQRNISDLEHWVSVQEQIQSEEGEDSLITAGLAVGSVASGVNNLHHLIGLGSSAGVVSSAFSLIFRCREIWQTQRDSRLIEDWGRQIQYQLKESSPPNIEITISPKEFEDLCNNQLPLSEETIQHPLSHLQSFFISNKITDFDPSRLKELKEDGDHIEINPDRLPGVCLAYEQVPGPKKNICLSLRYFSSSASHPARDMQQWLENIQQRKLLLYRSAESKREAKFQERCRQEEASFSDFWDVSIKHLEDSPEGFQKAKEAFRSKGISLDALNKRLANQRVSYMESQCKVLEAVASPLPEEKLELLEVIQQAHSTMQEAIHLLANGLPYSEEKRSTALEAMGRALRVVDEESSLFSTLHQVTLLLQEDTPQDEWEALATPTSKSKLRVDWLSVRKSILLDSLSLEARAQYDQLTKNIEQAQPLPANPFELLEGTGIHREKLSLPLLTLFMRDVHNNKIHPVPTDSTNPLSTIQDIKKQRALLLSSWTRTKESLSSQIRSNLRSMMAMKQSVESRFSNFFKQSAFAGLFVAILGTTATVLKIAAVTSALAIGLTGWGAIIGGVALSVAGLIYLARNKPRLLKTRFSPKLFLTSVRSFLSSFRVNRLNHCEFEEQTLIIQAKRLRLEIDQLKSLRRFSSSKEDRQKIEEEITSHQKNLANIHNKLAPMQRKIYELRKKAAEMHRVLRENRRKIDRAADLDYQNLMYQRQGSPQSPEILWGKFSAMIETLPTGFFPRLQADSQKHLEMNHHVERLDQALSLLSMIQSDQQSLTLIQHQLELPHTLSKRDLYQITHSIQQTLLYELSDSSGLGMERQKLIAWQSKLEEINRSIDRDPPEVCAETIRQVVSEIATELHTLTDKYERTASQARLEIEANTAILNRSIESSLPKETESLIRSTFGKFPPPIDLSLPSRISPYHLKSIISNVPIQSDREELIRYFPDLTDDKDLMLSMSHQWERLPDRVKASFYTALLMHRTSRSLDVIGTSTTHTNLTIDLPQFIAEQITFNRMDAETKSLVESLGITADKRMIDWKGILVNDYILHRISHTLSPEDRALFQNKVLKKMISPVYKEGVDEEVHVDLSSIKTKLPASITQAIELVQMEERIRDECRTFRTQDWLETAQTARRALSKEK